MNEHQIDSLKDYNDLSNIKPKINNNDIMLENNLTNNLISNATNNSNNSINNLISNIGNNSTNNPTNNPSNKFIELYPNLSQNKVNEISKIKTGQSNLQIYYDKMLGKGSFSKVFPGKYKGNIVAVKIITTKHLEEKITKQLERELEIIRILQKNCHKNIASYYKIFHMEDKMIIVMELCSGGELSKYIRNGLDLPTVRNYFLQILDGYKHLLELNIVHRDIKSANLLLSQNKELIKFIDFGLSKIFSIDLNQTICGSPLYMAPELLNHQDYDSKSDIWSLGVLLYEMVYGVTPFHQCKVIKTLKQTVQKNSISYPKKSFNNLYDVPNDLINYMKKLLEPDPSQRLNWDKICDANWLKFDILPEPSQNDKLNSSDIVLENDGTNHETDYETNYETNYEIREGMNTNINDKKKYYESSLFSPTIESTASIKRHLNKTTKLSKNQTVNQNMNHNVNHNFNIDPFLDYENFDDLKDDKNNDDINLDDIIDSTETQINQNIKRISSTPIPIKPISRKGNNQYNELLAKGNKNINGTSYPVSHFNDEISNGTFGHKNKMAYNGESFDDIHLNGLTIEDISFIENNFTKEYDPHIRKTLNITDSGLVDINDISDLMIANVPERTTSYEYISRRSSIIGSYLYSKSAPIASSVINGLNKVAKNTVGTLGTISNIISPKNENQQ
jgi:serine/threonine protein kinase